MATVSELSIGQANALKLQEEIKTKELLLEQSYSRLQKVRYLPKIIFSNRDIYGYFFDFRRSSK